MKGIKIRYYLQQEDTGYITTAEYTLEEIESSYNSGTFNRYLRWIFPGYFVLAKCEYTGLHDKNGKEIYEGDVVYIDLYKKYADVCQIMDGRFLIRDYGAVCEWSSNDIEIIGNIYENPELN